ncbi:hydantoinase/oxoprolinase family protein [Thiocystis violacea]|uniref:hydantoinase/oxoprolinase family protein n=1 Tax=Thiocystis violacea TaxID=13725 RepID=UPI0019060202|nr:hydantoinase/oxoprolinase family protein [Thiocystis violacea]MBK1718944.1 hypothetical protein [Thiocystis violacea]
MPVLPDAWIGWDLGATRLKAVRLDRSGCVRAVVLIACPLGQGFDRLAPAIQEALERLGRPKARHALTMTVELARLFEDRAQGVETLVSLMRDALPDETLLVYAGAAGLIGPDAASGMRAQVASARWMAPAALATSHLPRGLVVDVGSATVDLVPFADHEVLAWGATDHERLLHGELLYSGVSSTPLMALARQVPFDGAWVPLIAEPFATTADIHRLTGDLPEPSEIPPGAEGREGKATASARRLARMLGLAEASGDPGAWTRTAEYLSECQLRRLVDAAACLLSRADCADTTPIVGAGVGCFLAVRLAERLKRPYVGFDTLLACEWSGSPPVSDCAPAAAVAALAVESYPL